MIIDVKYIVRPANNVRFAMLDGLPALFSEHSQSIFALNPVAALVWHELEGGADVTAVERRLIEAGIGRFEARSFASDAIAAWLELGLLNADFEQGNEHPTFSFVAGNIPWRIKTASQLLSRQIASLFDSNLSRSHTSGPCLRVINLDSKFLIYCDERRIAVCEADAIAPTVKAAVVEKVLENHEQDIAFHAACVSWRGANLLISGAPGVGKSTIAVHLAANGFEYRGDDVTFISPDGLSSGVACAPTIKSGAWDIVARIQPNFWDRPVHRRTDGALVRYLDAGFTDQAPSPAKWIVFINRTSEAEVGVKRITTTDALSRLIQGCSNVTGKLSQKGFFALRRLLDRATSYEMTFHDSCEAAQSLARLCDVSA